MADLDTRNEEGRLRARVRELENALDEARMALALEQAARAPDGLAWLLACHGAETPRQREAELGPMPSVPGLFSIVVPAYNAVRWLEGCVQSVWAQDFCKDQIELVVVDDGSRDGSGALAEGMARRSPVAMQVLRHDGGANRGVTATRALGCARSRGEFIAFLDADDEFLPNRLAVAAAHFQEHPQAAGSCALGRNVDENNQPVRGHNGSWQAGDWRTLEGGFAPPFTFEQLWRADPIVNSSLTLRRAAYDRVGGFPRVMAHQSEDWLLALKLSLLAPIPCAGEEVVLYRHHGAAYTARYHSDNLALGSRAEMFYHLAWWMLSEPEFRERGASFFRREYPGVLAANGRLFGVVRDYIGAGGAAFPTREDFENHLARNQAELESLRRVIRTKLLETRQWRREALALREQISGNSTHP